MFHGCEEGFFIAEYIVSGEMVMNFKFVGLKDACSGTKCPISFHKIWCQFFLGFLVFVKVLDPCFRKLIIHYLPIPLINRRFNRNNILTFSDKRRRLTIPLPSKDRIYFYLSPYKICLLYFISECPPCLSSFQEGFYQV